MAGLSRASQAHSLRTSRVGMSATHSNRPGPHQLPHQPVLQRPHSTCHCSARRQPPAAATPHSCLQRPWLPPAAGAGAAPGSTVTTNDDFYDARSSSIGSGWERVAHDLGLSDDDVMLTADPQEWEEMVSLLSFDGEEHKELKRQMHGPNSRVEDMFASFDGDDFEAVMTAANSETPVEAEKKQPATVATAAAAADGTSSRRQQRPGEQGGQGGSQGGAAGVDGLYTTVCALRAAALAVEQERKRRASAVRGRKAALSSKQSADAWMVQVPYTTSASPPAQHPAAAGTGASNQAAAQPNMQQAHSGSQQQMGGAAASGNTGGSNNIVSSRALGSRRGATAAVRVGVAAAAAHDTTDETAKGLQKAQRLSAAPAAMIDVVDPNMATNSLAVKQQRQQPAACAASSSLLPFARALDSPDVVVAESQLQQATGSCHAAHRRWSGINSRALRRALNQLHTPPC